MKKILKPSRNRLGNMGNFNGSTIESTEANA